MSLQNLGREFLTANSDMKLAYFWIQTLPSSSWLSGSTKFLIGPSSGLQMETTLSHQSKAELTPDGQFSLKESTGQEIWNANVGSATSASMLDTGNFILSNADTGTIWQSFDNPTDTILPGQVVNQTTTIFAKLMDDDYSRGRFVLTLQDDGNLVLNPVAYPTTFKYSAYWSTMTPAAGMNHLVFNGTTGSLYLSFTNSSMVSVFPAPAITGDNYLRATLDPDGVFRFVF